MIVFLAFVAVNLLLDLVGQADVSEAVDVGGAPKKRTFRKFSYRGVDLDQLLDMSTDELVKLFPARARRRLHSVYASASFHYG